jgi:uncharacterized protein
LPSQDAAYQTPAETPSFARMTDPLFHSGERAAQALAGVAPPNAAIRARMPDQHRTFFGLLPFLPMATVDGQGAPMATIVAGPPGFIASPDPNTLHLAARLDAEDPAKPLFVPGAPVGVIGIDLATRRRNRANGALRSIDADGMTVSVAQSFGNCPQYIQTRSGQAGSGVPGPLKSLTGLDAAVTTMVAAADTFFVATSSGAAAGPAGGVDISHRGGRPGFVAVDGDTLTIPDFHGNNYFNTLGNLLLDPRAALLFVDWPTGTLLQLRGRVEILWNDTAGFAGAERLWRLSVEDGTWRTNALAFRWSFDAFAPQTLRTGAWPGILPLAPRGLPDGATASDRVQLQE